MTVPKFVNTYTSGAGNSSVASLPLTFQTTDPTPQDTNYGVPTLWANTTLEKLWILRNFNSAGGVVTANWILFSSELASIETITGNDSVIVGPSASNNVNIVGDGSVITTSGNALTNTETIAITGIVPVPHGGTGAASFNANQLVVGNGVGPLFSTLTPTVDSITINNAPINPTDGTNKAYVDSISAGFSFIAPVYAATTATLNAVYFNGVAGVGATLTNAGVQAAFSTDGTSPPITSRILVHNQSAPEQNGVYSLTTVGTGVSNWVLTRTTDYDTVLQIKPGNLVPVQNGTAYADTIWLQTEVVTIIGTDPIIFQIFANASNLQLNVQTFTASGTYTPTSGMIYAIVEVQSAGGGGGGANALSVSSNTAPATGGGGGEYAKGLFTASAIGGSQAVTIGSGGAGGVGNASGVTGGTSSFGALLTAIGGSGGIGALGAIGSTISGAVGGTGGIGGYIHVPGSPSNYSVGLSVPTTGHISSASSAGGNSVLGVGGLGIIGTSPSQANGNAGGGYGGGGSGAQSTGGASATGGAGSGGIVVITEYIT